LDAMECAVSFYKKPFDLIISGMNWGANVGINLPSGTVSAAIWSVGAQLAPYAISISYEIPSGTWYKRHHGTESLEKLISYPGEVFMKVIERSIAENNWGATVLNINLPKLSSNKIKFCESTTNMRKVFSYPVKLDKKTHRYTFPNKLFDVTETGPEYEVVAMGKGYITITPFQLGFTDYRVYGKLKGKEMEL